MTSHSIPESIWRAAMQTVSPVNDNDAGGRYVLPRLAAIQVELDTASWLSDCFVKNIEHNTLRF